ncbi:F-box domain contaning protein [Rhodotorula toruloides]|uniref:F-box domain contaning protein n=1 Tax=Rhodotorula toruloides TaxID=5286 RepID=A0A511KQ16_RHOTO|nr:F-box domain contaning protein [Rhodotorula toruloides]
MGGRKEKNVGRLEVMKTLPLELLIFSHLDPNDLLALSTVNKQYRSLASSHKVWENSRKKIDLPDLGTDTITEWQYAQLVFETNCQRCGAKDAQRLDPYLRKRLCKSCRIKDVVRLSSLDRMYPKLKTKLHPRAVDAARQTPYAETVGKPRRWRNWTFTFNRDGGYVSIDDLFMLSRMICDLEAQDEDEAILQGRSSPPPEARVPKTSLSAAKRKTYTSKHWRAGDESDSDDEPVKDWDSARVVKFINDREASLDEFGEVTERLFNAAVKAAEHVGKIRNQRWMQEYETRQQARQAHPPPGPRPQANPVRQRQIRDKVVHLGYSLYDVYGLTGKIVTSLSELTDGEWEKIKPKVIAALDRQCEKNAQRDQRYRLRSHQIESQRLLRPLYDAFKQSLPESARPFVPLFTDFLVLPSVKELWQPGKKVTSEQWEAHFDDIREEVDQFRLDLVLHARQLILDATTDPDKADGEREEPAEDDAGLDDAFLSRATSLLCCGFPGCPPASTKRRLWVSGKKSSGSYWASGRFEWRPTLNDRPGSFAALADVLKHMHADHNDNKQLWDTKSIKAAPQFHLALPLEVACAVSALLELHDLDPETATKDDLVNVSAVSKYEWENAPRTRRHFAGEDAWFDLIRAIKRKGEKLGKLKPAVALDPPCIVLKRFRPTFGKEARLVAAAKGKEVEQNDSSGDSSSAEGSDPNTGDRMCDDDFFAQQDEDEDSEVEKDEAFEGGAGEVLQRTAGDNDDEDADAVEFARYKAKFRAAGEDSASDHGFE